MLVSNPSTGLGRNFSCGGYLVLCGVGASTLSANIGVGGTTTLGPLAATMCVSTNNPNACSGQSSGNNGSGFTYLRTSSNTSIAQVSGSNTNASATFTGISPGTAQSNGKITLGNCNFPAQGTITVPSCPTSVSLVTVSSASLANNYPPQRTGIGGFAQMSVGPSSSTTYNGARITESVTQDASTTCPSSLLSQPAFDGACSGSSTPFVVGAYAQPTFGVTLGQTNNAFWDQHTSADGSDDMGVAGYTTTCNIVCDQTYSCGGSNIGSFVITRMISHTIVGSNPGVSATNVAVTKH